MSKTPHRRIGLFGGTFNPVHRGHVQIARDMMAGAHLDGVWFMPNRLSPLKQDRVPLAGDHRLAMLQLALQDEPCFEVTDIELKREGPSFTVDTVRALREQHPEVEWSFFIGADSLYTLHDWKNIEELLESVTIYVAARPGVDLDASAIQLKAPWPQRLLANQLPVQESDCSSTDIRARIAAGKKVNDLVAPAVAAYIKDHHIYV